ncbi:hypothetical protein NL676_039637 [Syzygium grande]|nr:hypothetical protein NL676_039637 [Syzygium grande]
MSRMVQLLQFFQNREPIGSNRASSSSPQAAKTSDKLALRGSKHTICLINAPRLLVILKGRLDKAILCSSLEDEGPIYPIFLVFGG